MDGRSALIVYSFAPKHIPNYPDRCEEAHNYLNKLWDRCDALGINEAMPESNIPTTFPTIDDDNAFQVSAAKVNLERRARGDDYQAFLFQYQDVFGFVATLEINTPAGDITNWKALLSEWTPNEGPFEVPDGIMEETYLFTALAASNGFLSKAKGSGDWSIVISNFEKEVSKAFTSKERPQWRVNDPYISDAGYCIWRGEQLNTRASLALLAPQEKKDDLFSWAVWPTLHALAPFARYLMYAAKFGFAQQVFEEEISKQHDDSRQLDQDVTSLVSYCKRLAATGTWNQDQITQAHSALAELRTKNFDFIFGISRLNELNLTSRIAARNMRKLVPSPHPELKGAPDTLFEQDRTRCLWLTEQIQMDLGYLSALKARISEGHRVVSILLERENQKTSRHLKDLVIVQGSLIGSIAIGLAALQAFGTWNDLVGPLIVLLMAIALALPILLERWHERYVLMDRIAGGLLGAAALFFLTNLADEFWLHLKASSFFYYVLLNVVVSIAGFLFASFVVGRLKTSRIRSQQHPEYSAK